MIKEYKEKIDDLPYGILYCRVQGIHMSIDSISKEHISVRFRKLPVREDLSFNILSDRLEAFFAKEGAYKSILSDDNTLFDIDFDYYSIEKQSYSFVGPFSGKFVDFEDLNFYNIITFEIASSEYVEMFDFVVKQYSRYIDVKTNFAGFEMTEKLLNSHDKAKEPTPQSYVEWIHRGNRGDKIVDLADEIIKLKNSGDMDSDSSLEIAVELENNMLINAYLSDELSLYMPIVIVANLDRIYLGNMYCPFLWPDKEMIEKVFDKASRHRQKLTVVLSYLHEDYIDWEKERLFHLNRLALKYDCMIELEINDWGYIELLEDSDLIHRFNLTFGRLLNKRRKDARLKYKFAEMADDKVVSYNACNDLAFNGLLTELGINRVEQESSGIFIGNHIFDENSNISKNSDINPLKWSIHLPFYQTNTAFFCTLDKAMQKLVCRKGQQSVECRKICEDYVEVYEDYDDMLRKYGSSLALDGRLLEEPKRIREYDSQLINRFVWNCFIMS